MYQSHVRGIFHAWKRDQDDLSLKIKVLFKEACEEFIKRQHSINEHMKQKFICNFLHEKVKSYLYASFYLSFHVLCLITTYITNPLFREIRKIKPFRYANFGSMFVCYVWLNPLKITKLARFLRNIFQTILF